MAASYAVYILQCRDGTLYTGWTNDLAARLIEHEAGRASRYTRSRLPIRLVYTEELPTASAARRREAAIKKMSRAAKLVLIGNPQMEPQMNADEHKWNHR